jgi:hypothetical protein
MADKYWTGKTSCNICNKQDPIVLFDARTARGPWALMCSLCFMLNTKGKLGTGVGQKYVRQLDGRYLKVEG